MAVVVVVVVLVVVLVVESISSSGCSYNMMLVRATASLPALCQLILDFITFRGTSLLQDVRFSTQLCHETNNLSSPLKMFFPATVVRLHSQKNNALSVIILYAD